MLETFDVGLVEGPNHEITVSVLSRHGAVHGVPRIGGNLPSLAELSDITEDFEDAVHYARRFSVDDVGTALRDLVFGEPEIRALFQRGRGAAAAQGNQMMVRLLAARASLSKVPWELMLDPEGGTHKHLTLAPDVHIVRAARSRTYPTFANLLEPPLNVLLILSSPVRSATTDDGSMTFDLFEEKRNLLDELELLQDSGILRIDVEEHPTIENLRRRIGSRRGGYHIVHYLGHAESGGLYLENRHGRSVLTPAALFTDLLRMCPQLRLSLFAGCETARAPAESTLGTADDWRKNLSTADQCVRDSCPTVIGMRAVLPFRTEWLFARFFYQGLASGYAIADAVRLARAAIHGDEFVGNPQLDWAVPCLIAGSEQLGPLIEPPKPAPRRPKLLRTELKFDLVEEDREFFARLVQLRTAIDVLGGGNSARVLVVTGSNGVGKTALVDRALQDLGLNVDCVLYFRATRLALEDDPIMRMARWVAELLNMRDQGNRKPQADWDGLAWWERLLNELAGTRFVIVIDDLHLVSEEKVINGLATAIRQLAERRGSCRMALIAATMPATLVDPKLSYVSPLNLLPFEWDELWIWIRRNLPVLTRFGKAGLVDCYPALGNDLSLWRDLGRSVSSVLGNPDLPALVQNIVAGRAMPPAPDTTNNVPPPAGPAAPAAGGPAGAPPPPPAPPAPGSHAPTPAPIAAAPAGAAPAGAGFQPASGGQAGVGGLGTRTQRALRVAIAGNHIKSPEDFARAMTQFAAQYSVGGRTVTTQQSTASRLAELLPMPPLFDGNGMASEPKLNQWLKEIESAKPDIVLMDFGSKKMDAPIRALIQRIAETSLVIAAAGHEGRGKDTDLPARLEPVLGVGALSEDGKLATYSSLPTKPDKPEIHAPESLLDSPLRLALKDPKEKGTSFAALRVTAAAVLVWSIRPSGDREWVRSTLLDSAGRYAEKGRTAPIRLLNINGALEMARSKVVTEALGSVELTFAELQGAVGFATSVLDPLLEKLGSQIVWHEEAGTQVYRLRT
jgi:hypothetical protein